MARQYSPKTFLRNVPKLLLKQYFESRNIELGFSWDELGEADAETIFDAVQSLPNKQRGQVESDFTMINDMACEDGTLAILEEASFWKKDWSELFAGMKNAYDRAFWTFLNEPRRFQVAGCFHDMDRLGGWRRRFVGRRLDVATDEGALESLNAGLREFYRKQGRGRLCHVDCYLRVNPERHCFFAYPEDHASTDLGFDPAGNFQLRPRQSAFEIIFVYRPDEGQLEIYARGDKKVKDELAKAFCRNILGLADLPDESETTPFDLNILKNAGFRFETDPRDRIAQVELKQIRLDLPFDASKGAGRRILLSATSLPGAPNAVHQLIADTINKENVRFGNPDVIVSQAKLKLTFAPVNNERVKTLTFDITYPDGCSLKDDFHDQIAKKYLKEWGIARD